MKKIAVYPGSFDPITKGHVDIIERAAKLFDEIIVGVATSDRKKPLFSAEQRCQWCVESLGHLTNVRVFLMKGLSVDFAKSHHANFFLRGIRTAEDIDYELSIAHMNHQLSAHHIETVFFPANNEYRFVSATMVREIIALKGDVSAFVPACVRT